MQKLCHVQSLLYSIQTPSGANLAVDLAITYRVQEHADIISPLTLCLPTQHAQSNQPCQPPRGGGIHLLECRTVLRNPVTPHATRLLRTCACFGSGVFSVNLQHLKSSFSCRGAEEAVLRFTFNRSTFIPASISPASY